MREEDPDGKKKYWLFRFTSESPSQWLMEGLKGGFKKARCLGGWMGYIQYCQKKQQKVENKKKMEFFFSGWAIATSLECKVFIVNGLLLSDNKTKPPWPSSVAPTQPNCCWRCSDEPCELWLCKTNVERSKRNKLDPLSNRKNLYWPDETLRKQREAPCLRTTDAKSLSNIALCLVGLNYWDSNHIVSLSSWTSVSPKLLCSVRGFHLISHTSNLAKSM